MHICDEQCTCPVHGTPLYYSPVRDDHACQDPACRYAHGDLDPMAEAIGKWNRLRLKDERRQEREASWRRITSAAGGCIGCDAPAGGNSPAAVCPSCWDQLTPVLRARLKTPPGTGAGMRLRYGGYAAEASAYLRALPDAQSRMP